MSSAKSTLQIYPVCNQYNYSTSIDSPAVCYLTLARQVTLGYWWWVVTLCTALSKSGKRLQMLQL